MIIAERGQIIPGFHVIGTPRVPPYLLEGEKPILIDGGMSHLAPEYLAHLKEILGARPPAMLLHTHMHFDHCGATAALKRAFPGMELCASAQGAEIIAKTKAQTLIRELNDDARKTFGGDPEDREQTFAPFAIDRILKDGDEIEPGGGQKLKVIATPGHTRDFLSYFEPGRKILIASEAGGCAHHTGRIMVEFASDYHGYLETIDKLLALDAQIYAQGHNCVFTGEDVRKFLETSRRLTLAYRKRAEELLDLHHGDIDKVAAKFKEEEWEPLPEPKQPGPAYSLNTYGRIRNIAALRGKNADTAVT